jgi:EKC/KEOPS complex subunit CGI121/TPRKB
LVEFDDKHLNELADLAQIRKFYKLDAPAPSKAGKKKPNKGKIVGEEAVLINTNGVHSELDDVREMEAVILGIMALKGS